MSGYIIFRFVTEQERQSEELRVANAKAFFKAAASLEPKDFEDFRRNFRPDPSSDAAPLIIPANPSDKTSSRSRARIRAAAAPECNEREPRIVKRRRPNSHE